MGEVLSTAHTVSKEWTYLPLFQPPASLVRANNGGLDHQLHRDAAPYPATNNQRNLVTENGKTSK